VNPRDDCLEWKGDIRKIGSQYVPAVRIDGQWRNALRSDLLKAEVITSELSGYYRACDTEHCMNTDHYSGPGTEVAVMVAIRDRSYDYAGCRVWNGQANPGGAPILKTTLNGVTSRYSVRKLVYEQEHGVTLPDSAVVVPTCGDRKCVHHKHLGIKPPVTRAYESTAGNGDDTQDMLARRAYARLYIEAKNRELMEAYQK
jgi:hypothetical protein